MDEMESGWLSINYGLERRMADRLNETARKMEQKHQKRQAVKDSIRNVFKTIRTGTFTAEQRLNHLSKTADMLRDMAKSLDHDAQEHAKDFSDSRAASILKISETKEYRKSIGLKDRISLDKALENAKNQVLKEAATKESPKRTREAMHEEMR